MKKITLLTAGCALTVLCALPALAAETTGPYVSGHLGIAMPSDSTATDYDNSLKFEYDSGLALDLALGYRFGAARLEGEIGYQKNDVDDLTFSDDPGSRKSMGDHVSGDTKTTSFLLNGYYDFQNSTAFTPYLTAGLGLARVKTSIELAGESASDSDTVFAYQLGAGFEYALNQTVSLDARYRYFATSDPSFTTRESEFSSHNLMLGARVKF